MSWMSWLLTLFTGAVLARFAGPLARFCQGKAPKVLAWLTTLDDRAEVKLGFKLPEWAHNLWDEGVKLGVSFAEQFFGSKDFWQKVFYIIKGRPALIADRLLDLLHEWVKLDNVQAEIPKEIRDIFNLVKAETAVTMAAAHTATLPKELQPGSAGLFRMVHATAPLASRVLSVGDLVTPKTKPIETSEILDRIAETKKKLLAQIEKHES